MTPTKNVLTNRHFLILTAAFAIFVVYGSLVPLTMRSLSVGDATTRFAERMSKGVRFESRSDVAANVLLFIPLGFAAAGAVAVDKRRTWELVGLLPAMAAFSAAIEFVQLWFPARDTTMNDVAAETLGGTIGVGAWCLFGQTLTYRARHVWQNLGPGDWAAKALPAYFIFLVIAHGMPFDLTLSPYQLKAKYDRGNEPDAMERGAPRIAVTPAVKQAPEKLLYTIVYFVPFGALLGLVPGRRWQTPAAMSRVLLTGFIAAAIIEFLQLIVISCGSYASDVLVGGLSVFAGWSMVALRKPLTSKQWLQHAGGYALALALVFWFPFTGGQPTRAIEWVPFADYQASNYLSAFNRILNMIVVFVPVGFFLLRATRWPIWSGLVVGTLVATVVEIGQPFVTTHRTSLSDVILGGFGGLIGGIIASRVPGEASKPRFQQ